MTYRIEIGWVVFELKLRIDDQLGTGDATNSFEFLQLLRRDYQFCKAAVHADQNLLAQIDRFSFDVLYTEGTSGQLSRKPTQVLRLANSATHLRSKGELNSSGALKRRNEV